MLRHAALLLDRENQRLHDKVKTLLAEIARLRGDAGTPLQHELDFLRELLAQRMRALFGPSSEKRPGPTTTAAPMAARSVPAGHGPRPQPQLPIIEQRHVLDEADRHSRRAAIRGRAPPASEVPLPLQRPRRDRGGSAASGGAGGRARPPILGGVRRGGGHSEVP
jgi:hypothetical protein